LKYPKRKTAQASVATKTFGILSKFADINILMYLKPVEEKNTWQNFLITQQSVSWATPVRITGVIAQAKPILWEPDLSGDSNFPDRPINRAPTHHSPFS